MRRPIRFAVAVAGAMLALAVAAWPALAHEEINPSSIQTGRPVFLILSAANEGKAPITRVQVQVPQGAALGETTRSPAGWTPSRSESAVSWTGGKVAPETFEQWGFELEEVDQPGTLTFTVTLTAGGESEQVKVPVTAVAAGTGSAPPTTVTQAAPTAAGQAPASSDGSSGEGRANLAVWLAAAGLLLGLVALVVAVARRRAGPAAIATPPATQDF